MPPLDIDSAHSLDHRQPDKPALCRSPVSGPPWSSRAPESHVRDPGAFNDPDRLQFDPSITEVLEEPYTAAKERGHEVDLDLVEESGTKLRNARPQQTHVLVTSCCLRFVHRLRLRAGRCVPAGAADLRSDSGSRDDQ